MLPKTFELFCISMDRNTDVGVFHSFRYALSLSSTKHNTSTTVKNREQYTVFKEFQFRAMKRVRVYLVMVEDDDAEVLILPSKCKADKLKLATATEHTAYSIGNLAVFRSGLIL
jgi:hypothetical protein